jgi:hypothetical protein
MNSKTPFKNKRRFSRIEFDTEVRLISDKGLWKSKLIDISLKGLLITVPQGWKADTGDHYLTELFADNEDTVIRMEVSVTHVGERRVGFKCEHIDLDSISHLRRLLELNIGDIDIINRELSELGHSATPD